MSRARPLPHVTSPSFPTRLSSELGHAELSCWMPRRVPPHRKLPLPAGGGLASALQVRIGDQLDRRLAGDFSRMRLAIGLSPHDDRCAKVSAIQIFSKCRRLARARDDYSADRRL